MSEFQFRTLWKTFWRWFCLWQDLDDTVQIVEKNPAKFKIDASELAVRKAFIQQTRDEVNLMKARAENPGNFSAGTRAMDVSTFKA